MFSSQCIQSPQTLHHVYSLRVPSNAPPRVFSGTTWTGATDKHAANDYVAASQLDHVRGEQPERVYYSMLVHCRIASLRLARHKRRTGRTPADAGRLELFQYASGIGWRIT